MRILRKVPIHPTFYLLVCWFLVCGQIVEFMTFLIALSCHEFGHFFVAKRCGYQLDKFFIAPFGASLTYKEKQFERSDEVKIALAGPIVNLSMAAVMVALWWIAPITFGYTKLFVEESAFLGVFNLLPAYPLDGGRIVASLLSVRLGRVNAVKALKGSNIVFAAGFLVMFVVSLFVDFNPTFAFAGVFLVLCVFDSEYTGKYKLAFITRKKIKNFAKAKHFVVQENTPVLSMLKKIDTDSYIVFDVITESGKIEFVTESELIEYCMRNEDEKTKGFFCKKT